MSIQARMNRLFAADGRCFVAAVDHGIFGERTLLNGIEDMAATVQILVSAAPDAIQLTIGQAHWLQNIPGRSKPSLVLRADVTNVYGHPPSDYLFCRLIDQSVEQALRLDAVCIIANLINIPGNSVLLEMCIENICRLKAEAVRWGMPLMVEPLIMKRGEGSYHADGDLDKITALVRQAVELGADLIKADPCDDLAAYHQIIEGACGVPVLMRGGGKLSELEVLRRTYQAIHQGARGIVYGRNVLLQCTPTAMARALAAIVHDGEAPEEAMQYLDGVIAG